MRRIQPQHRWRAGFTIVELLVVVAIIGVLIGLLLPAIKHAQDSAKMINEKAAARDMMIAYQLYADDHSDWVLPGYKDGLSAFDENTDPIFEPISSRYPWRLAPYLDYRMDALYKNSGFDTLEEMRNETPESYTYLVSVLPSLGLNSAFVGGDSRNSGFLKPPPGGGSYLYDITGIFYVRRTGEVRRPDQLIVFGSARSGDPETTLTSEPQEGYFRITSPYWLPNQGLRWNEYFEYSDPPEKFGNVSCRYKGNAVVAMFDGHVETMGEQELLDMRHWANGATKRDWRLGDD
ncbi:MAG: type II secretion system protein [Planctomycetota bacterium]